MFSKTKDQSKFGITIWLVSVLILFSPELMSQQSQRSGTITGRVIDKMNGAPLPAANIFVLETSAGAATNDRGVYILRRVSAGNYTIRVSYIGYQTVIKEITVMSGESVTVDFEMEETYITTDEVVVTELARGHARAFMEQREANIHKQVLTTEQMERFGDVNLAESLMRLPGISVSYDMGEASGVSIRGMGMDRNMVQIDGVPMASTSEGGRETSLETMSGEMVSTIEVIRVPTPDMPADALGGIVNLRTARPVAGRADLRILTTGEYGNMSDRVGPRASIRYSQGYGKFGISMQSEYRRVYYDEDRFDLQWQETNWGPTISRASPQYRTRDSERYGISGRLMYEPNRQSSFFISSLFNVQDNINTDNELRLLPHTGLVGKTDDGLFEVEPGLPEELGGGRVGGRSEISANYVIEGHRQLSTTFGGEHTHRLFNLNYSFTYAQGVRRIDLSRSINWRNAFQASFLIDNKNYKFPAFIFHKYADDHELASVYNIDLYEFDTLMDEIRNSTHFSYIGNINVEVPFSISKGHTLIIKFGSNYDYNIKYRRYARFNYEKSGLRNIPLAPFVRMDSRSFFGNPNNMRGPGVDFSILNPWFKGRKDIDFSIYDPLYTEPDQYIFSVREYNEYLSNDYDLTEGYLAGYVMATLKIGNSTLLGGIRLEHTYGSYESLHTEELRDGTRVILGVLNESFDYLDYFPSFHIRHNFSDYTIFRGALTYGMKRARFTDLIPLRNYNHGSRRIDSGNPELNPEKSIRIDFSIEHFFGNVGQISAGAFFNDYKDFIYTRSIIILEGDYRGWEERMPVNGLHAHYYGLELSWQQPLSYLPGILDGIGIFTNYTYLVSRAEIERPFLRTIQMPGLRPWELNLGISYDFRGFSSLITTNIIPDYMTDAAARTLGSVDMDRYQKSEMTVDVTIRQRITKSIRIAIDLKNITNTPRNDRYLVPANKDDIYIRNILDDGKLPLFSEDYRLNGWFGTVGLRIDL
jgi:TonB-dependent receptor